jgi:calcineurin-like phosphoesterase family protein
MPNNFIISDHHFGHANILTFLKADGTKLRPEFHDVTEMNEMMIVAWNKVVRPQDKVQHLGDVGASVASLELLGRCNGHKRLIRGNHDRFQTKKYLQYFEEIYGTRQLDKMILSHIPVHPDSIKDGWVNVHGHIHNNMSVRALGPKYVNMCVEHWNYTPVALEDLQKFLGQ